MNKLGVILFIILIFIIVVGGLLIFNNDRQIEVPESNQELSECEIWVSECAIENGEKCGPCGCKECCSGLTSAEGLTPFNGGDEGIICEYIGPVWYTCINCGDGICGEGENWCRCPEDCKEPDIEILQDINDYSI